MSNKQRGSRREVWLTRFSRERMLEIAKKIAKGWPDDRTAAELLADYKELEPEDWYAEQRSDEYIRDRIYQIDCELINSYTDKELAMYSLDRLVTEMSEDWEFQWTLEPEIRAWLLDYIGEPNNSAPMLALCRLISRLEKRAD